MKELDETDKYDLTLGVIRRMWESILHSVYYNMYIFIKS